MGSPRTSSTPPRTAAAEQPQISGVPTAFRCFTCYPSLDSPSRLVPSAYHGLRPKLLGAPFGDPAVCPRWAYRGGYWYDEKLAPPDHYSWQQR
jgi:hypothetical protein